jgi:transcriptional regulator with XRE-family HTH domain
LNAGVNTSYISQIERGENNPIKTLEKIALALEVTLLDLLLHLKSEERSKYPIHADSYPDRIKKCLLEVLIEPEGSNF